MEKEINFKEQLKTLAVKLGVIDEPKVIDSKFEEVVLADESKVMIDPTIEVGASVMIDVEGELQAVPDGTYELADKRKIVVVAGKIESIEEIAEEVAEEEMSTEDTLSKEDVQAMLNALGLEFTKDLDAVKNEFSAYKKEVAENEVKRNKLIVETFEAIGNKPSEVVTKKRNGFMTEPKNNLVEILKNKKNK